MAMIRLLKVLYPLFTGLLRSRRSLAIENLALRHQLAVYSASKIRPKLSDQDRKFWVWMSSLYKDWKSILVIVKPETVIAWHRRSYKYFWWRKTRPEKRGRYTIKTQVKDLIQRMALENGWGAPRIHGELLMLGFKISERSVSNYMPKVRPKDQKWSTFIKNHMDTTVAIDFLTVPTLFFKSIYVLLVISPKTREVLYFNTCTKPNPDWVTSR